MALPIGPSPELVKDLVEECPCPLGRRMALGMAQAAFE
jgi:hypothetical protein